MNDEQLKKRFHETFVNPDDAGMPLDAESDVDAYFWTVPRLETEDALAEIMPEEDEEQLERVANELNGSYPAWARRSDL